MGILEGKAVLITGVGPGLGRMIALEAGRQGADVAMVSRSTVLMEEVAGELGQLGRKALVIQADAFSAHASEETSSASAWPRSTAGAGEPSAQTAG